MVIFITGASHSGKTRLAHKLMEKYAIPYVCQDHVKMGLIRAGYTSLTPEDDGELVSYLWPVTREMAKTAIENGQDLILEGCYFPFDWRKELSEEYLRHIHYICLCFSEEYVDRHFEDIRGYACCIEQRLDDGWLTREALQEENRKYREGCAAAGLETVLINGDYEKDIAPALHLPCGGRE